MSMFSLCLVYVEFMSLGLPWCAHKDTLTSLEDSKKSLERMYKFKKIDGKPGTFGTFH